MKTNKKRLLFSLFFFVLFALTFFVSQEISSLNKWTQFLLLISGLGALVLHYQTFLTFFGSLYFCLFFLSFFYEEKPIWGIFEVGRGMTWLFFSISISFLSLRFNLKGRYFSLSLVPLVLFAILKMEAQREMTFWQKEETPVLKHVKKFELQEHHSGLPNIDVIYVINLDKRKERWERMKALCESKGLHLNRFSAVDGRMISEREAQELAGPYIVRLDGGKMGCLLSHLSLLNDAQKRGFRCVWVLEDDIAIEGEIASIPSLVQKLSAMDPEWDILYTDPYQRNFKGESLNPYDLDPRPDQRVQSARFFQERTEVSPEFARIRDRLGTHSMILSRKGIDKILDYYRHVYLWVAYDRDLHYITGIREYCTTQKIVTQNLSDQISDTRSSALFYSSVTRLLTMGARVVKDFIIGTDQIFEEECP